MTLVAYQRYNREFIGMGKTAVITPMDDTGGVT
jgi:hypothetical protein